MFEEYTLKNGARIILAPHDTASTTTLVTYPVGSRYEPEHLRGVSHYIEHIMFKGTQKRKSAFELTRAIDRLGAEYNAYTGKEETGYYIKADSSFLDTSMDILSDMLFNSVFDAKEMEKEKGPVIEELKMYRDNPLMNIDNVFEETMFTLPLGGDEGGTDKHVASFKRPDVLAYRDKYYDPGSMIIIVTGMIPSAIRELIDSYFGSHKKKVKPSHSFKAAALNANKKTERICVQEKKVDQAQLMMGFPAFAHAHKDMSTLSVMNVILGGSMSSRLFVKIREQLGLAYVVRSGHEHFRDTGYVYASAGLDAKNVNKAIAVIAKEFEKLCTTLVGKQELADAKTHLRGALTLSMENSSNQAEWYAKEVLFHKTIETPEQYLAHTDKVTREDIMRVAKQLFKMNQLRVAVIGDIQAKNVVF